MKKIEEMEVKNDLIEAVKTKKTPKGVLLAVTIIKGIPT